MGCFSVPGSGGANTSGYKLFEMMQNDGHDVHYVNIISEEHADYFKYVFGVNFGNPKRLPNVHNCILTRSLFHPDSNHAGLSELVYNLSPDVLIGIDFIAALLMKSSAKKKELIFLTAGCNQAMDYIGGRKTKDLISFTKFISRQKKRPKRKHQHEFEAVRSADLIINHSDLNQSLYHYFFPEAEGKIHPQVLWKAEWIYQDALEHKMLSKPFSERDIDVIFVANRWNRPEKNYDLVKQIIKRCCSLEIHIVGEVNKKLADANYHGLIADKQELYALLGRSKMIVCPSTIDAAPGILFEASAMGCNIVASKNCGNWQICHDHLLVDPFNLSNFITKISLGQTKKFDDNIDFFLKKCSYENLVEIISVF